jgi:uncharacterized membrane protein YdbT with pleckstrin-like domain
MVVVTVYKVVEIARKEHERKEKKAKLQGKDLTDEIAEKVLEKLEPRFAEIDRKLDKDKERLEVHESSINSINVSLAVIKEGMEVTVNALAEVVDHELHNGNTEQMAAASVELRRYANSLLKRV